MTRLMTGGLGAAIAAVFVLATAANAAAPARWAVDPAHSKLGFTGSMNGGAFSGAFKRWSADIAFDPKDLSASKADVVIDVGSAATGEADRDQAMPTPDWFAAGRFPKATFATSTIKAAGGDHYTAQGTLSIRGVSRPVTLPFTLDIAGDTAKMTGQLTIDRTAFGVGQGPWADGQVVATKVSVDIEVTARRIH